MARKDLMALYGRLSLVVAVFAFVAAIVVGPLLQKVWPSQVAVSEKRGEPILRLPRSPVSLVADKQG